MPNAHLTLTIDIRGRKYHTEGEILNSRSASDPLVVVPALQLRHNHEPIHDASQELVVDKGLVLNDDRPDLLVSDGLTTDTPFDNNHE